MKIGIVVVALALLCVLGWIIWSAGAYAVEQPKRETWPAGLDTLDVVARRYPPAKATPAAQRLVALAAQVGVNFGRRDGEDRSKQASLSAWLMEQRSATSDRAAAPPPEVSKWLDANAASVVAVRAHLLSGQPIAWDFGGATPLPNLLAHLQLSRQMVASALLRESRGVAGSWDDLHGAWELSLILQRRPELISRLVAMGIARQVNSAAMMLSGPAPEWFGAVTATDFVKPFMESMQFETLDAGRRVAAGNGFRGLLDRIQYPGYVKFQHGVLSDVATTTACGADAPAIYQHRAAELPSWNSAGGSMANLGSVWSRAWRYRVEREGTANALRIHAGLPIVQTSACSDVSWAAAPANGGMLLRYSGPPLVERGAAVPRELTLRASK